MLLTSDLRLQPSGFLKAEPSHSPSPFLSADLLSGERAALQFHVSSQYSPFCGQCSRYPTPLQPCRHYHLAGVLGYRKGTLYLSNLLALS